MQIKLSNFQMCVFILTTPRHQSKWWKNVYKCTILFVLYLTLGGCKINGPSEKTLGICSGLLSLDKEELRESLITRVMQTSKGGSKGTLIKLV